MGSRLLYHSSLSQPDFAPTLAPGARPPPRRREIASYSIIAAQLLGLLWLGDDQVWYYPSILINIGYDVHKKEQN